jgi:hydroxyacylglutathione hydrolase
MIHKSVVVGPLQCNCAILGCERTREAVIVDPGDEAGRILAEIAAEKLQIKYILHTHAHFDHVGATGGVRKSIDAKVCLHKGDEDLYRNLPLQGRLFGIPIQEAPPVEKFLEDGEVLSFGDYKLETVHTPGHSPGSICFRVTGNGEEYLFSGDTLFQQSVGRSDLWGGDHDTLIKSIRKRLLVLDDDTPVHPGHGPSTLVGVEKRSNPFLI